MIDHLPRIGRWAGWVLLAMVAVAVITVPLDARAQWQFAGATILGAMVINRWPMAAKQPRFLTRNMRLA